MDLENYIEQAIREGRDITILYEKFDGTRSERTVSDIQYSEEYGKEYISGFCHYRGEQRTFKISRIRKIDGIIVNNGSSSLDRTACSKKTPYRSSASRKHDTEVTPSNTDSSSSYTIPQSGQSSNISESNSKKEGCYIATMAYGSYDHPKVMILRWYRDNILQKSVFGRIFIHFYYYISPKLVAVLKGHDKINRFIRYILDKQVIRIKKWIIAKK